MSEKRFVDISSQSDEFMLISDTYTITEKENGKILTDKEVVALLNELNDENEQLRQQVQILKKEVRDFLHLCDVCDIQSHLSDECEEVLNDE